VDPISGRTHTCGSINFDVGSALLFFFFFLHQKAHEAATTVTRIFYGVELPDPLGGRAIGD